MRTTKYRGDLAEAAFLYRAVLQGHSVFRPFSGKSSCDCIIDNGLNLLRIQVKSCEVLNSKTTYHIKAQRGGSTNRASYSKQEIDVLAVYLIPEDTFHLFPVDAVAARTSLSPPPPSAATGTVTPNSTRPSISSNPQPGRQTGSAEEPPLFASQPCSTPRSST